MCLPPAHRTSQHKASPCPKEPAIYQGWNVANTRRVYNISHASNYPADMLVLRRPMLAPPPHPPNVAQVFDTCWLKSAAAFSDSNMMDQFCL